MIEGLNARDLEVILESLSYSKQRIEEYRDHPSSAFKKQQVERIEKVMAKVRAVRDNATH